MTFVILSQETQELQRKQSWYQQNQVSMTKEDEEEYLNFCSEAMFRIHILEQRLNRFNTVPYYYIDYPYPRVSTCLISTVRLLA